MERILDMTDDEKKNLLIDRNLSEAEKYDWLEFYPVVDDNMIIIDIYGAGADSTEFSGIPYKSLKLEDEYFIVLSDDNSWFVANYKGELIGHDMTRDSAEAPAEKMKEKEPEEEWEALK